MRVGTRRATTLAAAAFATFVAGACGGMPAASNAGGAEPVEGAARFRLDDSLERQVAPFSVVGPEGYAYGWPFLGGFEVPRPQFADIDADGDLDFFIQKYSGAVMFIENVGTTAAPDWEWRTDRWQELEVGDWMRLYDADGDGDLDVFHELPSSYMRYLENVGTPDVAEFRVVQDSVRQADGRALFSDAQNIPFFVDIDCNGAFDAFLGRVDGSVSRYELVGMPGGVPTFELVAERFENIEIVAEFGVTGEAPGGFRPNIPGFVRDTLGASLRRPTLHGANSMAFGDYDADGDLDLFWGDFFEPGLLLIENRGSCQQPDLDVEPGLAPTTPPVATSGYNASALPDLDGDGNLDLVIGVLGGAFNANSTAADNLHFYRGSASGRFALETERYLGQLDIGSDAVPAFGDLDGDGDLDLLIGSRLDPETAKAPPLYHFTNTGTSSEPAFEFTGLLRDSLSWTNSAPVLTDLDADGDLDLLIGTFNRDVRWYRNDGSAAAPAFVPASSDPIADLPRGSYSTPAVGDLDADGDLDMVVGESSGEVNHFENVGSPSAPVFELVTEAISDIDVGARSSPALVDVDGDGDLDLVVGDESRGLGLYRNVGTPEVAEFSPDRESMGDFSSRLTQPRFVDIDADGDLDLVLGDQGGGLHLYMNRAR